MKKKLLSCVAALTALSFVLCACGGEKVTPDRQAEAFSDADATYTIDGKVNKNARNTISDTLFGVFLEDINYAGYLLDDNLVYNGAFETFDTNKSIGWTATGADLTVASSGGVLAEEEYYGTKGVNANYANIAVNAANGGVSNGGRSEMPMAVESGVKYIFSAFVKTSVAGATMKVAVTDDSTTYCEANISLKEGGWVKYEQTLTANASASEKVKLEITFDKAGTYSVDAVALETQNATGGIKQYAFDAIKELGPKFVRFPGGCIIEGDDTYGGAATERIYDWKNSVGAVQTDTTTAGADDIPAFEYTLVKDGTESTATTYGEWVTRRQNADLWGRNTTEYGLEYGIGFYEYFLLCENLGASAVPVLNCGLSDHNKMLLNGRHGKGVSDYIADAIDLIEFAKGDKTTKWGGLRAALGHEEPFEMSYLGIGNEQATEKYYVTCYEEFLKNADFQAACSKYGVKTIVGNDVFFTHCQNGTNKGVAQVAAESAVDRGVIDKVDDFGVHDQHYYVNYSVLFENAGMYEDYARPDEDGYYEVFVGEYSANEGITGYPLYKNSLITALSEAAMMTSYENNGDIIKLAAYAPMFGVANKTATAAEGGDDNANQWDVDMMYYTNTKIVKSANYYIQQLFMQNQGKYRLSKSKLTYSSGVDSECTLASEGTSATKTIQKLYTVASKAENGDLILKVVNASGENIKLNVAVEHAKSKGIAYYTEVSNADSDWKAVNTVNAEKVTSKQEILGFSGGKLGQEIKAYSAACFRIRVK